MNFQLSPLYNPQSPLKINVSWAHLGHSTEGLTGLEGLLVVPAVARGGAAVAAAGVAAVPAA